MTTTKNGGSNSGHHHHHHHHHHRHHASANLHSTPAVTSVNNVGVPVGGAGTVPILHGSCLSVVANLNGPSSLATCSSSTSPTSISTSVSICNRLNESQRGSNEAPDADVILALLARNKALQATIPKCAGCEQAIFDRFILKVLDRPWHAKCLKCAECGVQLADKCYVRSGQLFCKDDFFKRFGTKCAGCEQGIPPTQIVRRAHDNVYHLHCFICVICTRQLNTGDEFYLMEDNKLVCKHDYEAAKARAGDSEGGNKRPRTTISAKQLETLKTAYSNSPKPARHVREQLSQDTGLDMRVVQVWFQNRRAKEKRLKKDAGRTRWGQYFRNMKQTRRDKRRSDDHSSVDGDKDQSFQDDFSDDVINSDIGSNSDSYGHGGPMTSLDQESYPAGPHLPSASFLPGGPGHFNGLHSTAPGLSTPPTLPGSRSPIPPHTPLTPVFNYTESGVVGFTPSAGVGANGPSNGQLPLSIPRLISNISGPGSDVSNTSSNQGYPEFPPSPESWLDDVENSAHAQQY